MSVTLIAGLGNPGKDYDGSRHNLGFALVDALAAAKGLKWKNENRFESSVARWDVRLGVTRLLIKPQTYMNDSGRALRAMVDFYQVQVDELVVAYDDLTIDLGLAKVSVRGSAGGHNGVASLLEHLGSGFIRYRLGVGVPRPAAMDIKDFVLAKFSPEESHIIDQQLNIFVEGLCLLIDSGVDQAMNTLNRRDRNESDQP